MNLQTTFDFVARHLITQGRQAKAPSGTSCRYRTRDDLTCAVGCLIPEDRYNAEIEGGSVQTLVGEFPEYADIINDTNVDLLLDLQRLHDLNTFNNFAYALGVEIHTADEYEVREAERLWRKIMPTTSTHEFDIPTLKECLVRVATKHKLTPPQEIQQ